VFGTGGDEVTTHHAVGSGSRGADGYRWIGVLVTRADLALKSRIAAKVN